MNLIEAVKSGKRFKRKSEIAWMSDDQLYNYVKADIIAEDWEIEEKSVTITRNELAEAWEKSRTKNILGMELVNSYPEFDALAKELGL